MASLTVTTRGQVTLRKDVLSLQALCEFAWVLNSHYKTSRADISASIGHLLGTANVIVNRPAVEAGLSVLNAGGDFVDGVIAYEGNGSAVRLLSLSTRRHPKFLRIRGDLQSC